MILAAIPAKVDSASFSFWSSMGWVDAILMIVFLLGIFFGIRKGLAHMLAGLMEIIIADVVVIEYTAVFTGLLTNRFHVPVDVLNIIMFAVLAVFTILILRITFKLLALIATVEFKQPFNHILGALVGGLQFMLFFALIAEFLMFFQIPFIQESFQQKSISGPYLIQACEQVHYIFERWIPASLQAS